MKKLLSLLFALLIFVSCSKDEPVPAPVANFSFLEFGNYAPSYFAFSGGTTNVETYIWDFGDGQSSDQQNPDHIYVNGGTYNVTLTVKNSAGVKDVINKTIVVKSTPTKMKINSMIVTSYPVTMSNGGGWDSYDGPDIFPEITGPNGTTSFSNYRKENVTTANLPLTFSSGFPFVFSALDYKNTISFYDYDPTSQNDDMGGYYFTVKNYMPTDGTKYPSTINLYSNSSSWKLTLNVEWGY